jgi:hypothetical protein
MTLKQGWIGCGVFTEQTMPFKNSMMPDVGRQLDGLPKIFG